MKIRIESDGHCFTIPLPIRIALNGFTMRIFTRYIKPHTNIPLNEEALKALRNELINAKREFKNLVLVDVISSDGDIVRITL